MMAVVSPSERSESRELHLLPVQTTERGSERIFKKWLDLLLGAERSLPRTIKLLWLRSERSGVLV